MPFLRVVRDKRGYETTYLIHSTRDGSHQASRVLYAFRSPGGVRVGRVPFEPEVRREIESRNPGIAFDWDTLVSGQQLIDATPDQRRPRRRPPGEGAAPPPAPKRVEAPPQAPRLAVPSVVEGETPEMQMRFLAHWHGILCERLPERIADPERREAMMLLAQRLNPAGWIDADEIAAGLQKAGEALEQLSRILSKRRRKSRRSGPRDAQAVGERALPQQPFSDQSPPESIDVAPDDSAAGDAAGDALEGPAEDADDPSLDEPDPA